MVKSSVHDIRPNVFSLLGMTSSALDLAQLAARLDDLCDDGSLLRGIDGKW